MLLSQESRKLPGSGWGGMGKDMSPSGDPQGTDTHQKTPAHACTHTPENSCTRAPLSTSKPTPAARGWQRTRARTPVGQRGVDEGPGRPASRRLAYTAA